MTFERMSPTFAKQHHGNGRATHYFTGPDEGGPHDHPNRIDVEIVSGGYLERAYTIATDGGWTSELIARNPGDKFTIEPEHIHEIVELPTGECVTEVQYHPHVRETRFWRFDENGIASRVWHEPDFA